MRRVLRGVLLPSLHVNVRFRPSPSGDSSLSTVELFISMNPRDRRINPGSWLVPHDLSSSPCCLGCLAELIPVTGQQLVSYHAAKWAQQEDKNVKLAARG